MRTDHPSAEIVRPPVALLSPLFVALILGMSAIPMTSRPLHVVGWVLGAIVVPTIAVGFRVIDGRRRNSPLYVARNGVGALPTAGLVLGIAVAIANAYRFFEQTVIV